MTFPMPTFVMGLQPQRTPPVQIEVRVDVDRVWGDRPLTGQWAWYTPAEYEELRGDLVTQVGDPDGTVSVWTGDHVEVLVPSRRIRGITITTRPFTAEGGGDRAE
jgi:hypothetical protein